MTMTMMMTMTTTSLFVVAAATATTTGGGLPEKVFWDNNWPSDLTLPRTEDEDGDDVEEEEEELLEEQDLWSLEDSYYTIKGQTALNSVGDDETSTRLTEIFQDINNQVLLQTWDGEWKRNFYLPSPDSVEVGSKFQIKCGSTYYVNIFYDKGDDYGLFKRRVNKGEELILIVLNEEDGDEGTATPLWFSEEDYIPPPTGQPVSSPSSSSTADDEKKYELLEGTVLFAQSQIIPSKNGIPNDNQPHLTALRKTLVMLRPHHCLDEDNEENDSNGNGSGSGDDSASSCNLRAYEAEVQMTVRNGDGDVINKSQIMMADPKNIPKQTAWIHFDESLDDTDIPSTINGDRYVVQYQSNLNNIGNDVDSIGLTEILNRDYVASNYQNQIEIKTWDGSWVKNIYLPSGPSVPLNSKVQLTCDSGYDVNLLYPDTQTGGFRKKKLSKGKTIVAVLVDNGSTWLTQDDLSHNEYVFGYNFYTSTLDADWVLPGMTLEFTIVPAAAAAAAAADSQDQQVTTMMGILDDIDIGGVTELMITTLDAGFLTEPRSQFTFANDEELHREYFETTMASRLIVVQYESMYLEEIMLPTGRFYGKGEISDTEGGWHTGDMRGSIGKLLLSHGIDLANYGISSSSSNSENPHPFTCALLAAHNTVGMYQNGRQVHGGSGGNGMVTLDASVGNEFSHEIGHNYGLGHYVDGFNGSVHRSSNEINSSWAWDSQKNVFTPNFASSNTEKDQCYDNKCQSAFDGKYQFGTDSMAGGSPNWSNRYTMYSPNTSKKIQLFLEGKAVWDPSSSTGFRKYDSTTKQMEEFTNYERDQKVPRLYRVPVTTVVGYYDPDHSTRDLESYIYPAMHGAYGFVYNDDGSTTTPSGTQNGCELVVETRNNGALVFDLSTTINSSDGGVMNKFHVNIATADEPYNAKIYCQNEKLATRALEDPNSDESPLTYTVMGVPFESDDTLSPTESPVSPTSAPVKPPPTYVCKDRKKSFQWNPKSKRNCVWLARKNDNKIKRLCKINKEKKKIWTWCRKTCGDLGVGRCAVR